jgi:hypothetical protein
MMEITPRVFNLHLLKNQKLSAFWRLFTLGLLLVALAALSGCVLTMPDPLLKSRNLENGQIPTLATGTWVDEEKSSFKVESTQFNNTYLAIPEKEDDANLTIIFLKLSESHYIIQAETKGGKGVFLSIAVVSPRKLTIYSYPDNLPEIIKIGSRNGVTITDNGLITKYTSAEGIIQFFREISVLPKHKEAVYSKK